MRFKKGDRVKVIKNIHRHDAEIGSEITIDDINSDDEHYWFRKDGYRYLYGITDEEVEPIEHECKYCGVMTSQDDEECYANPNAKLFTQQQMIDFAQHLLKDFSTQEVTLSDLNDFLNIKQPKHL